jgi:HAMP domain-containing protein
MSSKIRVPTLSVRYAIPAVFIVLIVATVGLVGWLAFRSGQRAIDDLATQLSQEATARIEEHVRAHLSMPHLFHQINAAAVRTGNLNLDDFAELERYFWDQVQLTESVPFIYLGSERGEFIGVQREDDGTMILWILDESMDSVMDIYQLDDKRNRVTLIDSVEFDPRVRPWYRAAVEAGKPTWSEIYPDIARPILIITSVIPLYSEAGELQGVLGIEFSLGQISDFLRSLEIGRTGQAFIIERTGDVIASSAAEPPFLATDEGQERLTPAKSSEPLIRSVGQHLLERFGSFEQIYDDQQFILDLDGVRQFVQVTQLHDGRGLDWLIVVILPETDFMEPIYANVRSTALLGVLVLALATLVGFLIAQWIIRPILAVTDAAIAVETEEFAPESLDPVARRTDELGRLARVFQRMASEVRARERWLKEQLQDLRIEIDEVRRRTQVDKIVETEFFQDLQTKAHAIRSRGGGEDEEKEAEESPTHPNE